MTEREAVAEAKVARADSDRTTPGASQVQAVQRAEGTKEKDKTWDRISQLV
eukprot:CAMPEP_0206507802 /NCGR_PEP_ID=MMETSP0324_2-20121206/57809_1 /ASSEMBLY_ACC=CAM_ASM_000836 /TAXON_ID=2866 /ORGANISM="Crypthecodinium cohnii, Strain Seligo" /LENGTH=50 /DNA_ID=CAMNT_0053998255 /DNA_START=137 /DNA_END=289 /DNA_ORIENTATION=+